MNTNQDKAVERLCAALAAIIGSTPEQTAAAPAAAGMPAPMRAGAYAGTIIGTLVELLAVVAQDEAGETAVTVNESTVAALHGFASDPRDHLGALVNIAWSWALHEPFAEAVGEGLASPVARHLEAAAAHLIEGDCEGDGPVQRASAAVRAYGIEPVIQSDLDDDEESDAMGTSALVGVLWGRTIAEYMSLYRSAPERVKRRMWALWCSGFGSGLGTFHGEMPSAPTISGALMRMVLMVAPFYQQPDVGSRASAVVQLLEAAQAAAQTDALEASDVATRAEHVAQGGSDIAESHEAAVTKVREALRLLEQAH